MEADTVFSGRLRPMVGRRSARAYGSRRAFLSDALLSLAWVSVAPWALGRGQSAIPARPAPADGPRAVTPPAGQAATGGSGHLSAMDDTGRLTTAVRINGRGPYHFMVDTGAERTFIAEDLAATLALPRGEKVMVQGIVRGQPSRLVTIQQLRMGSLVSSRLEVPTLPRSMLGVDGYLGLDVLDQRRVIFDFRARTLTITKPQGFFSAFFTRGEYLRVPTLGSSGRLRSTDCVIDGVRAAAFFDTGADVSIINTALYDALAPHKSTPIIRATEVLTGVTGGSVEGGATLLDTITLGDLVITSTPVVVADLPVFAKWNLDTQPALLIGMSCLRRCARVSIDYRRMEVRFELAGVELPPARQAQLPLPLSG